MLAPTDSCKHVRSYQAHAPQAYITSRSDRTCRFCSKRKNTPRNAQNAFQGVLLRSVKADYLLNTLFQSFINFSIPMSVKGCFSICMITLKGTVAMCAPFFAESVTS